MKKRTIEITEEVYQALAELQQDFGETPNAVLERLLLLDLEDEERQRIIRMVTQSERLIKSRKSDHADTAFGINAWRKEFRLSKLDSKWNLSNSELNKLKADNPFSKIEMRPKFQRTFDPNADEQGGKTPTLLYSRGIGFHEGMKLRKVYKGKLIEAEIKNGKIVLGKDDFESPSAAASAATGTNVNGWSFWEFLDSDGIWKPLATLKYAD